MLSGKKYINIGYAKNKTLKSYKILEITSLNTTNYIFPRKICKIKIKKVDQSVNFPLIFSNLMFESFILFCSLIVSLLKFYTRKTYGLLFKSCFLLFYYLIYLFLICSYADIYIKVV